MELVDRFKALSDKTRLMIISLLCEADLCVCEIVDVLKMSQSRISGHLKILKQAGLIKEDRVGKWVIYKISDKSDPIILYTSKQLKKESSCKIDIKSLDSTLKKKLCPVRD